MKNKLIALSIKLIFTFFAAWLSFGYIGSNTYGWILLTAIVVTLLTYFVIDLIVFPSFGNIIASILDGILAAITAFLISLLAGGIEANNQIIKVFNTNLLTLAFFAIVIAVMEYFFHLYLLQSTTISYKKDNYK